MKNNKIIPHFLKKKNIYIYIFPFLLLEQRERKTIKILFQKSLLEDKCNLQTLQHIKSLSKMSNVFKSPHMKK